jgi:hypothetical protein
LYGPDRRRRCATQMDHERLASWNVLTPILERCYNN